MTFDLDNTDAVFLTAIARLATLAALPQNAIRAAFDAKVSGVEGEFDLADLIYRMSYHCETIMDAIAL
jgi:hypothetical protein